MIPAFASKLSLPTQKTNVDAQKITSLLLQTYGIATIGFFIHDKLGKV